MRGLLRNLDARSSRLSTWLLGAIVLTGLAALGSGWTTHPLSATETLRLLEDAILIAIPIWRLLAVLRAAGHPAWAELARLATLMVAALLFYDSFLTSNYIGSTDGPWNAYIMIDAINQARAGVFPVWIGQSEHMYNGAIHPYITAPNYTHLGILIDCMTAHALPPLAVEHLVVITTVLMAALIAYACLAMLLPARRWTAWCLALLYVSGAGITVYIYSREMYLTAMTFTWLPLVAYGNIRLLRQRDQAGWTALVAGLALTWFSHAPVATWTTIYSALVQGVSLAATVDRKDAHQLLAAGLLFCGLALGYFVSVRTVTAGPDLAPASSLLNALFAIGGGAATIRYTVDGRRIWWIGIAAGLAGLGWLRLHFALLLAAMVATGVAIRLVRTAAQRGGWKPAFRQVAWVTLALAGLGAAVILRPGPMGNESGLREYTLRWMFPGAFLPLSTQAISLSDIQPGYSALVLFLMAGIALLIRPRSEVAAMFAGAGFLLCLLAPIPGLNPLLFTVMPSPLYNFSLGPFVRFTPLMYTLMIFGGALALGAFVPPGARWWRRGLVAALLLVAIVWNAIELREPLSRIEATRSSPAGTEAFYRPENGTTLLIYNELPSVVHSDPTISDVLLKSHLLSREGAAVIPEPFLAGIGGTGEMINATPDRMNPGQFLLEPRIQIEPGYHLLLRLQGVPPSLGGHLDIGAGGGNRRIMEVPLAGGDLELTLWNSGQERMDLGWRLRPDPSQTVPASVFLFARGEFRLYRGSDLRVQTRSLIPYRTEVRLDQPARLETPRVAVPGYTAIVNGRPVLPAATPNGLVTVPVEPGDNIIEIQYHGTGMMRIAWLISAICWAGLIAHLLLGPIRAGLPHSLTDPPKPAGEEEFNQMNAD
ncbi:MAG: hypothetical protein RIS76_4006 [Verrucomicrobiota bacterium]